MYAIRSYYGGNTTICVISNLQFVHVLASKGLADTLVHAPRGEAIGRPTERIEALAKQLAFVLLDRLGQRSNT